MKLPFKIAIIPVIFGCVNVPEHKRLTKCLLYTQRDSSIEFSGIVSNARFEPLRFDGHSIAIIGFADGSEELVHAYSMCCYVQPGDSAWKRRGSLKYYVERQDTIKIFYPECGKYELRDSNYILKNDTFNFSCGRSKEELIPY